MSGSGWREDQKGRKAFSRYILQLDPLSSESPKQLFWRTDVKGWIVESLFNLPIKLGTTKYLGFPHGAHRFGRDIVKSCVSGTGASLVK